MAGVVPGDRPWGFFRIVLEPITAGRPQEGWLARPARARDRAPCPKVSRRTNLGVSHFQALSYANSVADAEVRGKRPDPAAAPGEFTQLGRSATSMMTTAMQQPAAVGAHVAEILPVVQAGEVYPPTSSRE